jgi:hypothetical protein
VVAAADLGSLGWNFVRAGAEVVSLDLDLAGVFSPARPHSQSI